MNSETHSWTHSFASLAIFAVGGTEDFMILATLAIYPEKVRRVKVICDEHCSQAKIDPVLDTLLLLAPLLALALECPVAEPLRHRCFLPWGQWAVIQT